MDEGRAEREELLRRQLKVMSADQFEVLVFELARREEPDVRRLIAPDGGADTLRPAISFTLYDARHTFVSTLMAGGVPLPEVAAYSGHSVGEISAVAADDRRLRSQTTLTVYTHATGKARGLALDAVGRYLEDMLAVAPRLRVAVPS
jgi:integrase